MVVLVQIFVLVFCINKQTYTQLKMCHLGFILITFRFCFNSPVIEMCFLTALQFAAFTAGGGGGGTGH